MKTLILFIFTAFILNSSLAHAFPAVGDYAIYTQTENGVSFDSTVTVTAVNQSADQVQVSTSVMINGQPTPATTETQSFSELVSQYNMINQCSLVSGSLETISAANISIPTCHTHYEIQPGSTADSWLGKVPFGMVKSIIVKDNISHTTVLKSFKQ